jgi:tetratricopeptide (TPR) repeat protein
MTLKAMGNLSDAIALYQQAIILNPEYAEAYQNLGVVFYKLGRVTESLDAFNTAIKLHEKSHSTEAERLRQGLREMGLM